MGKVSNPFAHHHDHDHGHDEPPLNIDELDPAQKSLADALRVSFLILKVIMLFLVIYYVFSGLFNVKQNEEAVRLRFGRIVQHNIEQGGPNFAWPYPIEEVVKIITAPETIQLKDEFWFRPDPAMMMETNNEMRGKPGPLDPQADGYLVTGDVNIVHVQWSVTYAIENTADYITNIGDDALLAGDVVRTAVEQALVRTAGQLTGDDLINGRGYTELARDYGQANLDAMSSGITIIGVDMSDRAIPASVYGAYIEVTNAETDKGKLIDRAQKESEHILRDTAGGGYEALWRLITAYERALDMEDEAAADELGKKLDGAFKTLQIDTGDKTVYISGKVASAISAAKGYRTQVVEQANAQAETFTRLLPEYRKNPRIVMSRMWQDAREAILTGKAYSIAEDQMPGAVETLYLPSDAQLRIHTNRDPDVTKQREERSMKLKNQARLKAEYERQQR